jgi:hypothetical protein
MKIKIIEIHGYYEGEEPNDCGGDYWGVEVVIDGEVVMEYGNHYDDKGAESADAFVAGYLFAKEKKCKVEYVQEARLYD